MPKREEPKVINFKNVDEMPEVPISLSTTLVNKTGSWRNIKPVISNKYAPCAMACPALIYIPKFINAVASGEINEAFKIILERNPFPSITGRLCEAKCEVGCNRNHLDKAISIRTLEKFVGDFADLEETREEDKGVEIGIIGGDLAGLTCAYYLAKWGYNVKVYGKPFGWLNYLPEFKLPKEIIEKEKRRLEKLGVKFEKEKKIEEIPEKYKFVGLMPFYVDYLNYDGKEKAVSLKDFIQKEDFEYKKVLFIGSDIWTINFARLLRRKNIEVIVLTKEKENKTMAPSRDIEMAKEEGVEFFFEAKPVKLEENSGKFIMNLENGEKFEVDIVVDIKDGFGFKGYDVDRNTLKAKETEGVWAVPSGEIDLTRQIWWGAQGAKIIDAFINGKELEIEKKPKKVVSFKKVNYAYFDEAERIEPEFLSVDKRTDIYEDEKNYKLSDAIKEAERCFVCGFCNSCGNCWVFCPDGAILFDKGYPEVNYDYCKGCGICAEECPRGIIEMVPER